MEFLLQLDSGLINEKDFNGWTGFHTACHYGEYKAIKYLIEKYP